MLKNATHVLNIAQESPGFVPFQREGGILGGDRDGILSGDDQRRPDINIGLSVLKREAQPIDDVINQLQRNGWSVTDTIGDNRLVYLENSGVNITAIQGPMGTVIIPSGPIRGRIFGEQAVSVSRGEAEGIIPRGPILSRAEEMARREPSGFNGSTPSERDAENRPGPRHTDAEDVIQ